MIPVIRTTFAQQTITFNISGHFSDLAGYPGTRHRILIPLVGQVLDYRNGELAIFNDVLPPLFGAPGGVMPVGIVPIPCIENCNTVNADPSQQFVNHIAVYLSSTAGAADFTDVPLVIRGWGPSTKTTLVLPGAWLAITTGYVDTFGSPLAHNPYIIKNLAGTAVTCRVERVSAPL